MTSSPCVAGSTTLQKHTSAPWSRSEPLCSDLLAVRCDTGSGRRASGRRASGRRKEGRREEEVGGGREGEEEEGRSRRGEEEGERILKYSCFLVAHLRLPPV